MTLHMDRVLAGQKGGRSRSKKKRDAVRRNAEKARRARWAKKVSK